MNSYIEIGNLIFRNQVTSIEVHSSRKQLTQTATIRLPRFKKLLDPAEAKYKINVGDAVLIQLGYGDTMVKEFEGYISEVSPTTPLEIKCEDEMWLMKQSTITQSWPSTTLQNVIQFLIPEADLTNIPSVTLTSFRLNRVTKAQALAKLKEEYGLTVYFRNKKLFAGLAYTEPGLDKVTHHFQKNIPKGEASNSLLFKRKEDVKLKVKAISILKNNKKIEVEIGDSDGEEYTLHFYNLQEAELRKQAAEKINLMKYEGYRGSFKALGLPYATHGMVDTIYDKNYPERQGDYFIDATKLSYDSNGYRREIFLGRSASAPVYE